ncbi:MAG: hypothetical protein DLM50_03085 [Candidatus Meridianibacter frigidus]|nr:MAG: hypothetical protein DLM50_03085 [Candidatus Eremiobacteraeota bacterium]
MPKPLILFVCKHNTGRSQMAEAYLRQFAGDAIEVASAGSVAVDYSDLVGGSRFQVFRWPRSR